MKKILNEWRKFIELNESSFYRFKSKIDEQKMPFALVSAYRKGGNNQTAHKNIKADLVSMGYSFTEVVGGGQEEAEDPAGMRVFDEEGKPAVIAVREMTLLVTPEARGLGGFENTPEETLRLFGDIKHLTSKYDQFAFIFGYPREIKDTITGDASIEMFIAAYGSSAEGPGEAYRFKEPWAGPWSTIEEASEDDVYYTKIAGTRGALVQEFIKKKIQEIKSYKTKNQFDRMKKNYEIKKWKSLL